jgi:hypothetical protein
MGTFLKNKGWTIAADGLGLLLLATLLIKGTQSALFAVMMIAAPIIFAALMLWGPDAE